LATVLELPMRLCGLAKRHQAGHPRLEHAIRGQLQQFTQPRTIRPDAYCLDAYIAW
jgi:hypothetical protein